MLHLAFWECRYHRAGHGLPQQGPNLPYSACHSPASSRVPIWQSFFFKDVIYLFFREGEKHQGGVASQVPRTGHQPRHVPWLGIEPNNALAHRPALHPLSHPSQGPIWQILRAQCMIIEEMNENPKSQFWKKAFRFLFTFYCIIRPMFPAQALQETELRFLECPRAAEHWVPCTD